MKRVILAGTALVALCFGAVSCGDSGPVPHCVDWDTHKVTSTVTPKPAKTQKRVYDRTKHKYVYKWVDGKTPSPYKTTTKSRYCDEWVTPTPTNT